MIAPASGFSSSTLSVVLITHNEGRHLQSTVKSLHKTLAKSSEIIIVDDCSSDDSTAFLHAYAKSRPQVHLVCSRRRLGVSRARNVGAAHSRGEYLVFVDAHLTFPTGWQDKLTNCLQHSKVGAVAPAISDSRMPRNKGFGLALTGPDLEVEWLAQNGVEPYPVPLLPGGCIAMRRQTFRLVGGFDHGLLRYGVEDCELSLRLWLLGYELLLVPSVTIGHLFRDDFPYDVNWKAVVHNRLRMAFLHFNGRRLARVVRTYRDSHALAPALALMMSGDVATRRAELHARRIHDDNWLFEKFNWTW